MFDHDDADTFSDISRLRHARDASRPGPGAAWGKAANAGHRAPRPVAEDGDGNPIPARNSQAGALQRYWRTDDTLVLQRLEEQALDVDADDYGNPLYSSIVMLPPSVIQDDCFPWFSFKCRPYAFVPGRTVIDVGRGPELIDFSPAGACLVHPDVEYAEDDLHVGAEARAAFHARIIGFLQGKEMEITLAWAPNDMRCITAAGVKRIRWTQR